MAGNRKASVGNPHTTINGYHRLIFCFRHAADYQHLEDALSGFTEAREVIKNADDSIFPLGYKGSKFDFYRFVNRYRLAKQFAEILLDGFEEPATDGYLALTRVFRKRPKIPHLPLS